MSLILSRRDIDFLLFEWLDVEALLREPLYAEHDRETLTAVIDLAETLAEDFFAPANKIADQHEPVMTSDGGVVLPVEISTALDAFRESGLLSASQAVDVGGMQLPFVIDKAAFAWLQAASPAIAGYALLSAAAANLLIEHGSAEQIAQYARPLLEGRRFGTMCLSEPQAGSSLADVRTRAAPDGATRYRLFGNKMWISGGEHSLSESITHLVLARVDGAAPGIRGLSLFIVPRALDSGERNDIALAGLNHKMGQRGTVNTLLNFGEGRFTPEGQAGAIGYLVGAEGDGLKTMFTMMNEARIAVGTSAAAIGYTGFLHAVDYARTRTQGRRPAAKDPTTSQIAIVEHPDVRRMLLTQKAYVEGALALNLYCARLVDKARCSEGDQRADLHLLLDLLTPIAKSWPSHYCLEANSLAIQVHGGYGYTRDYNVEQFYRDNRLNPIHEGTNGIHAIDLLGRKVVMQGGRALDIFADRVRASCERGTGLGGEVAEHAAAIGAILDEVLAVTAMLHDRDDIELTLANASVFLDAFGHMTIGWIWLEQIIACHECEGDFYDGKRAAARFFRRWELATIGPQLGLLASLDRTTLDLQPAWL
ncbi:acyl-CoA dehydrogenase [uncultured Sphingobium sp.]|uniref:acyl-CoA dehydrogenase n=1 Tax=uncultured Sphingobium sp. TaxID=316087 RepID=UPI00259BB178|nr:acyl-CoA dehydrogenase [uncultured Sphingobium sp.]